MRSVTFDGAVLGTKNLDFIPGVEYLIPETSYDSLVEQQRAFGKLIDTNHHIGKFDMPERFSSITSPFASLLLWNTGGVGDQLCMTWFVKELRRYYPEITIDVVCGGDVANIWYKNQDIRAVRIAPIQKKLLDNYSHYLFLDEERYGSVNWCSIYERLWRETGIAYAPPEPPKPILKLRKEDHDMTWSTIGKMDEDGQPTMTQGHIVFGLHSRSQSKNLHPNQTLEIIYNLNKWCEGKITIYGVSNDQYGMNMQERIISELKLPNYVPLHNLLNVRQIGILCYWAGVVISPDSMLVHLAASQATPTVALFGPFNPEYIAGSYEWCESIWKQDACHFAPCDWRYQNFIYQVGENCKIAPCYSPQRNMCNVMADISTREVIEAVDRIMNKKLDNGGYNYQFLTQ